EAISRNVEPGSSVVLGACLEPDVPFAATYEIIRQGLRGLNVIAPISDASTDMLIGAGCVSEITGAWVGNVSGGLGHNYRRAFETGEPGPLAVHDHSNFSLAMALLAGAHGMPYVPMRSILGSDILRSNPDFRLADNPFTADKEPVVLVPPLRPDVAVLPVQRADRHGTAHHWGSRGLVQEAALAAERVILLADEIAEPEVIASDPGRVLLPGYLVTAVCHVPAGAHPSPMTGRWQRDTEFFSQYHRVSRSREGFLAWLREWVLEVPDHAAYRAKLGPRLDELRIKDSAPAAAASYAAA
ncbi:MAG: CoA transferase subunit A, partial [Gemmatimonadetes bacterium]|nr:CoA transferase subunit A [Gemmatimonadota bacterium]NIT66232.1 CoA transferase subunit A [Gemmatimonadota bacterium]NIW76872.1 CoA transferase subunit A [Gemmatimonadota bacterium]NIY34809.1 CoA transferase subunit A [Gemmatimonadota bacterium]